MKTEERLKTDRREVLAKIDEYEKLGGEYFFADVEEDPPAKPLKPEDVDYLCRGFGNKCKRAGAVLLRALLSPGIIRRHGVTVTGAENLRGVTAGAIFTSNHFSPFENLAVRMAAAQAPGKHRFYCVIREGNYAMNGMFGFLLRHCDTLPLSSCHRTVAMFNQAVGQCLSEGAHILVYPEQAMWYRYRKPRPYRIGAFYLAARNGVPVVPCFVTMEDTDGVDSDGAPLSRYTVHVLPPIFPDPDKTPNENAAWMRERNAALTRAKYEEVYGEPLTYAGMSPEERAEGQI